MKRHHSDGTWELTDADLRNPARLEQLARELALGALVYAPHEPPRPLERQADAPLEMHTTRPDPKRMDALRRALRRRQRDLKSEGAFYHRVTRLLATGRATRLAP
ncbi:MAG TPA: hypothetical protein VGF94_13380 [Kofleriaceae bacterium]|jgi:hypothetical protein